MLHILEAMGFFFVSAPLSYPVICCRRGQTLLISSSCSPAEIDAALRIALMRLLSAAPPDKQGM